MKYLFHSGHRTSVTVLSIICCFWGCAHIEPPSGGPKDEEPPRIVAVYPPPDAINQPRNLKAVVEFSKWVKDDFSTQDKITISPALPRKLAYMVLGDRVEVTCGSMLDSAVTYVLSVSPNVSGINGKKLHRRFDIRFSTGPFLDSAHISGVVQYRAKKPGVRVLGLYPTGPKRQSMAYLKSRISGKSDSLPRPGYERPMYLIATDSSGFFQYSGIGQGSYGLIGFEDKNSNQRPDFGVENVGIGPAAFKINTVEPIVLTLAPFDTTLPALLSARWRTVEKLKDSSASKVRGIIQLKFNKPMHQAVFRPSPGFMLISNDSLDTIPVTGRYVNPAKPENIELVSAPLLGDTLYRVICTGVADEFGNMLDTSKSWQYLRTGGDIDSSTILVRPIDIRNGDSLVDLSDSIRFSYSHVLTQSALDSVGKTLLCEIDSQKTSFRLELVDLHTFLIKIPPPSSYTGQWVTLTKPPLPKKAVLKKAVADSSKKLSGKKGAKSQKKPAKPKRIQLLKFRLINAENWTKCDIRQKGRRSYWLVQFNPVPKGRKLVRSVSAHMRTTLDSLPQGKYMVSAIRDDNRNGRWDAGRLNPWTPQEPFLTMPDTLELKAGEFSEVELSWPPQIEDGVR